MVSPGQDGILLCLLGGLLRTRQIAVTKRCAGKKVDQISFEME